MLEQVFNKVFGSEGKSGDEEKRGESQLASKASESRSQESLFGFVRSTASSLAGTAQQAQRVTNFSVVDIVIVGQCAAAEIRAVHEAVEQSPLAKNLTVRVISAAERRL